MHEIFRPQNDVFENNCSFKTKMNRNILTNIRFGMVNYLKTGNVFVDMVIASFIPLLIAKSSDDGYKLLMSFYKWVKSLINKRVVIVEFEHGYDNKGNPLSNTLGVKSGGMRTFFKSVSDYLSKYNVVTGNSNIVMSYEPAPYPKPGEELLYYKFSSLPNNNTWIHIENGVYMKLSNDITMDKDGKTHTSKYSMKFKANTRKQIDVLIRKIFDEYVEKEMESQDLSIRYMYTLEMESTTKIDKDRRALSAEGPYTQARRYKMMMQKSFDSIFFPQKKELLTIVDAFLNKSGVYAIKGYAHKLGLMLHGEPGTGKTSIIKALANYTKRHIVMVSLSKVKTNSKLIDLMFDPQFKIINDELPRPVKVLQSDCIFVFEDIDACCDIVKSREDSDSVSSGCSSDAKKSDTIVFVGEKAEIDVHSNNDALTLAGILNVLDGPLEAENRIVVFTSNHPETLDAALIRPGRIDHKFYLTYATVDDICSMVELYFGHCEPKTRSDLEQMFKGPAVPQLTPANLEVVAVKSKDQYEFVHNIKKL